MVAPLRGGWRCGCARGRRRAGRTAARRLAAVWHPALAGVVALCRRRLGDCPLHRSAIDFGMPHTDHRWRRGLLDVFVRAGYTVARKLAVVWHPRDGAAVPTSLRIMLQHGGHRSPTGYPGTVVPPKGHCSAPGGFPDTELYMMRLQDLSIGDISSVCRARQSAPRAGAARWCRCPELWLGERRPGQETEKCARTVSLRKREGRVGFRMNQDGDGVSMKVEHVLIRKVGSW